MNTIENTEKTNSIIIVEDKERDYFFDNLKTILIFCVIFVQLKSF